MGRDGVFMSAYKPNTRLENEELLILMKKRILRSYKWREDVVIPFARELEISPDELEEVLMKRLDMASLEAINPRFESSKVRCMKEKIHSDLKLCWLCDVMNIITKKEADKIKDKITFEVMKNNKPYAKALDEGRRDLLEELLR